MTKKQTTDKINKPEFAPEEWRKAAIMYDTSFAWCKSEPHHPSVNAMDGASGVLGPRLISTVGPRLRN